MTNSIPAGSHLHRMSNGDILIYYPHAPVPSLCVEKNKLHVRTAITREPVEKPLADAARQYVQQHPQA